MISCDRELWLHPRRRYSDIVAVHAIPRSGPEQLHEFSPRCTPACERHLRRHGHHQHPWLTDTALRIQVPVAGQSPEVRMKEISLTRQDHLERLSPPGE